MTGLSCGFGPRTGVSYAGGAPAVPLVASGATLWWRCRVPSLLLMASAPPSINFFFLPEFQCCGYSREVSGLCPVHLVPGNAPTTLPCCCCRGIGDVTPVLGSSPCVTVFPALGDWSDTSSMCTRTVSLPVVGQSVDAAEG